jgi:hypothetical protein
MPDTHPLHSVLDSVPVPLVFVLFIAGGVLAYEVGYRSGLWWQRRTSEEVQGPTGMLVGALLALMGFLIAVTTGMAAERFDERRHLVTQETNAIGTTFLRAGYLDEPYRTRIRNLLREYAPNRVATDDDAELQRRIAASTEITDEIWRLTEEYVRRPSESATTSAFVVSLNEVIDLHTERIVAGLMTRVPPTVIVILVAGSAITVGMVGYNNGLNRGRSMVGGIVVVVVLGTVLTLIVDLDRPRDGLLRVSQEPLRQLSSQLGPPE